VQLNCKTWFSASDETITAPELRSKLERPWFESE